MKKIFLIFVLFTVSCGYQPIYLKQKPTEFIFTEVSLIGDKEINRRIVGALSIKEIKTNLPTKKLFLSSNYKVDETSKNSKGQVLSYKSSVIVDLKIEENKKIIKEKKFFKDFTYNNTDNKFDLVEYQSEIKKDIIDKIIEDIILQMNIE